MNRMSSLMFEPIVIKKMKLKNRIVMAPMHSKFASESGEVTPRLYAYLVERARGGVGLIILENTCIDWAYGRAAGNPVTIHDDLNRAGLSNLPLAVHPHGAKIITQLHFTGRQNLRSNIVGGMAPVAPSPVKSKIGGDEPRALEESEIWELIQKFVDAARRTKEAGFDGLELHAAHGYIFSQFFSPYTNRREDKWGGTLENRARFPREVVRRIRLEVGPDFPIFYRLSAEERIPGGTTLEDTLKLVRWLDEDGMDVFDVTAGIYDSMEWVFTTQGVSPGSLVPLATAVKNVTSKPVIGISRLGWDLGFAARLIEEKKVDLVSIGRSLLADPYLPKKYFENRAREIRPCIACNDCVGMMFQGWQIHCTVNPELGNEYLDRIKPARAPKNVVIIGGGPAGMQCALICAQRGHHVTLIEKTDQLGGMMLAASTPAYKRQEIEAFIEYFKYMLNQLNVKVMLNTEIGDKFPDELKADVAVIATGASSRTVEFKGSEFVLDAVEVLQSKGKGIGKDVVIIGASGVGIDVALYLKEKQGKRVRVVEKLGEIGGDVNVLLRANILKWAEEKGVEFCTDFEVLRVEKGKVIVKTLLGEKALDCDTVISATGFTPNPFDHVKRSLEEKGMEVVVIGNANEPGKIFDATQSGFWIGTEL